VLSPAHKKQPNSDTPSSDPARAGVQPHEAPKDKTDV